MFLNFSLNFVFASMNITQSRNPAPFEIVVASAAPAEPIAGRPQRPKINKAFNMIFRNTITTLAIVHSLTKPTFFRSVSKTDASVMKTYEKEAIRM